MIQPFIWDSSWDYGTYIVSHKRPAKAQASLRIHVVSQSLCWLRTWGIEEDKVSNQKSDI